MNRQNAAVERDSRPEVRADGRVTWDNIPTRKCPTAARTTMGPTDWIGVDRD